VDAAVLQVQPGDGNTKTHCAKKLTTAFAGTSSDSRTHIMSHSWSKKTKALLQEAQHLVAGSKR
jgi:hypothetical protein